MGIIATTNTEYEQAKRIIALKAEIAALKAKLAEALELLRDVHGSGVELKDNRMSYQVVQISNVTMGSIGDFLASIEKAKP